MRIYPLSALLFLIFSVSAIAAPTVEVEIATERGLQITAPQQWLQLLKQLGVENVQVRTLRPGDEPAVSNRGTADRPRYHVTGILSTREELHLPGSSFTRGDAKRLKDYLDKLAADGDERLTAQEGHFGLTEKELRAIFADLSQPVDFETKGQSPRVIIDRLQPQFKQRLAVDAAVDATLRGSAAFPDELKGISRGTALAILLRNYGLVFRPDKQRGQAIVYQIAAVGSPAATPKGAPLADTEDDHAGKIKNIRQKNWPVGWELENAPGAAAPSLFEKISAEIDNYTMQEALDAIGPRLKIPYFVDHRMLGALGVEPAAKKVKVERMQISYMRLLERILSQARLGAQVRVDEAGTVFLWISR